jgi:lipid A ethanolaminephosphotransferase
MFSFLDRANYSPDKANKQSNVLDILSHAGVKTIWIDNNSSCKGVCSRIEQKNIRQNPDNTSIYYSDGEYYDEKLLDDMQPYIENTQVDTLIVLHTLGSHGPAYHRRFPEKFAKFTPYCTSSTPQTCSDLEVSNAYDNTILYTDYILSQLIQYLKQHDQQYESFLVYASDHGESLGENGVYLHGLPYFIAPEAQTHVPLIAWFSDSFTASHVIDLNYLQSQADQPYSHDNLSHSLLSLFNVKTALYQSELDLFTAPVRLSKH